MVARLTAGYLVITPADTEPLVPVMFPPGPAGLHLRPPDGRVALALAGGGVEPVHALVSAPVGTATAALRVFLQHDLLPSLLLVPALQVGLDHHLHLLLSNLSRLNIRTLLVVVWCDGVSPIILSVQYVSSRADFLNFRDANYVAALALLTV